MKAPGWQKKIGRVWTLWQISILSKPFPRSSIFSEISPSTVFISLAEIGNWSSLQNKIHPGGGIGRYRKGDENTDNHWKKDMQTHGFVCNSKNGATFSVEIALREKSHSGWRGRRLRSNSKKSKKKLKKKKETRGRRKTSKNVRNLNCGTIMGNRRTIQDSQ